MQTRGQKPMSAPDRINRTRWSRDQRSKARAAFAVSLPSVDQARADKLAALRETERLMADLPHMARTLAIVRAQIAALT